jgi:hypothetical protein
MTIFNSFLYVYQRVWILQLISLPPFGSRIPQSGYRDSSGSMTAEPHKDHSGHLLSEKVDSPMTKSFQKPLENRDFIWPL